MTSVILQVRDLHAYYDKSHILRGINLEVHGGEIVCLLGRNGSGRSTLARSIMNMTKNEGHILFKNNLMSRLETYEIAQKGIGYIPEDKLIFDNLTVEENLLLGRKSNESMDVDINNFYNFFPRLKAGKDLQAGYLSGGEKQMLTIFRTLMGAPSLVILDEPSEGLAPNLVDVLKKIIRQLKANGVSILLIEQKLSLALELSDRVYVLGHGKCVFEGSPKQLIQQTHVQNEWLAI